MFKTAQCLIIRRKPTPYYAVQTKILQQRRCVASKGKVSKTKTKTKTESPVAPSDGQLPSLDKWKETFWHKGMKPTFHNLVTGRKLVEAFGIKDAKVPKVIIETFAGPGVLSRALCELPPSKMSKLIILENNPMYLPYLETLAALDKRVILRPYDGWSWDSYSKISSEGLLDDIEPEDWNNSIRDSHPPHSKLHFIATTLPWDIKGESLFNQMFRAVASRDWLFKYGAMPFSAVFPDSFWKRAKATVGQRTRCKLSCMVEATVSAELALDSKALETYPVHFFPPHKHGKDFMVAANFRPLGYQVMRLAGVSEWDFVLRALFVSRSTPISQSLKSMAPGAQNMVKYMNQSNLGVLEKAPLDMTLADWADVLEAFQRWPFHPTDIALQDSVLMTDKRI
ncbi:S-adenosyl-L-methionine-dependent methyltransferase [Serendipita vermifera]|nr:S-adenosyl-L-methionine-dependent methyltransferase [Serendipita vermifera]